MLELHTQLELDIYIPVVTELAGDKQKQIAEKFFGENSELLEQVIHNVLTSLRHTELERVASVCIRNFLPFSVEIERVRNTLPQPIFEAFSRHLWCSQYSFADIYLIKVDIGSKKIFLLFHLGVVADGWDNEIGLLEIFTE